MFEIILDYLRSGFLEEMSNDNLMKLKVEAEYFMLTSLLEIINQRLSVEEQNNSYSIVIDEVNVFVEGQTFKCKPHALQYCDKKLIDQDGDFIARDYISDHQTLMDLVRRLLRRLEDNRVGDVEPPMMTELWKDSCNAMYMGLLPGPPSKKWFF